MSVEIEVVVAGPPGPQGLTGVKGDTGNTGAKGDKGDTGNTGAKGDKGDTGNTGAKGDKGDQGDQGDQGVIGPTPSLSIGTVDTGAAAASLTGTDEDPVLNLTIPPAANDSITSAMIAADAVGSSEIAANAVGSSELADNAVDTAAIADGAVTSAKIAAGTIVSSDVAADTFAAFGTVGNLLSANQAAGTASSSKANCTQAGNVFTAVASGAVTAAHESLMPVTEGRQYTLSARLAPEGMSAGVNIAWRTSGDVNISQSAGDVVKAGARRVSTVTATAPPGAAYARMYPVKGTAVAGGNTVAVDRVAVWEGRPGDFDAPGVPVRNQDPVVVPRQPWRFPGLHVAPASEITSSVLPAGTAKIYARMFRAPDDIVVTGIAMASGATPTSGETFARYGLWHVGDHAMPTQFRKSAALLARGSNSLDTFTAANTVYNRGFSTEGGYPAAVRLRRGEWYAVGYLLKATSPGTVVGGAVPVATIAGREPLGMWSSAGIPTEADLLTYMSGASMTDDPRGAAWFHLVVDQASTVAPQIPTVLLGDSITASHAFWFAAANAQSGSKLLPVMNAGVSGERLDQMLTRIPTHVTPYAPQAVVLMGGVNDLAVGGMTAATMQSRITAILDALETAVGGTTVVCTITPFDGMTAGQKSVLADVNAWILALDRPGVVPASVGTALSTGDGVTADISKLYDTVHPNPTGTQAMANLLDDVFAATF